MHKCMGLLCILLATSYLTRGIGVHYQTDTLLPVSLHTPPPLHIPFCKIHICLKPPHKYVHSFFRMFLYIRPLSNYFSASFPFWSCFFSWLHSLPEYTNKRYFGLKMQRQFCFWKISSSCDFLPKIVFVSFHVAPALTFYLFNFSFFLILFPFLILVEEDIFL